MNKKAVILAGGMGRRMGGRNKANLKYDIKTFLDKIIDNLLGYDEIILSLNRSQVTLRTDVTTVYDINDNIGPISGLYEGLKTIKSNGAKEEEGVLILPCDTPNITNEFISYLYEFDTKEYDAIVVRGADGRIHPLIGIYRLKLIDLIEKLIEEEDYKIFSILNKVNVKYVDLKYTKFTDDILKNINTLADYEGLQKNIDRNIEKNINPFIVISGIKNSGKTSLIEKLIKRFRDDNISVGTLKHDGHDFRMDNQGSDTDKYIKAGAAKTLIFSKSKFMYLEKHEEMEIGEYLKYFDGCDLVLLEGFKGSEYPKIEIIRKEISTTSASNSKGLLFYVTDVEEILINEELTSIHLDNVDRIYNEICSYLKEKRCLIY